MQTKYVIIKENSFIAKIAVKKLRSKNAAIVLGHRIHLHGVGKHTFLPNKKWLRHELKHVEQYEQMGFVVLIITYVWQTLKHGLLPVQPGM